MSETPTRGVPVMLDRERRLRFPLSAVKEMDEGTSLDRLLWLGLRHEDPDLTQEQVADMIDMEMLLDLRDPLKKATAGRFDLEKIFRAVDESEEVEGEGEAEKKGSVEQTSGS